MEHFYAIFSFIFRLLLQGMKKVSGLAIKLCWMKKNSEGPKSPTVEKAEKGHMVYYVQNRALFTVLYIVECMTK